MRDAKDVVPYDVVVILFVGEDSILPLKLDVFLFGRLIAYPYDVVRCGLIRQLIERGRIWNRPYDNVSCGLSRFVVRCGTPRMSSPTMWWFICRGG